LREDT
jgi:hypothetical protein